MGELTWMISFLHAHTLCLNIRKPCVKCAPRKRALNARAFIRNVCPNHSLCHASMTSTQIGRNFDRRIHSGLSVQIRIQNCKVLSIFINSLCCLSKRLNERRKHKSRHDVAVIPLPPLSHPPPYPSSRC